MAGRSYLNRIALPLPAGEPHLFASPRPMSENAWSHLPGLRDLEAPPSRVTPSAAQKPAAGAADAAPQFPAPNAGKALQAPQTDATRRHEPVADRTLLEHPEVANPGPASPLPDRSLAHLPSPEPPIADLPSTDHRIELQYSPDRLIAHHSSLDRPIANQPSLDRRIAFQTSPDRLAADRPVFDRQPVDREADRYAPDLPPADRERASMSDGPFPAEKPGRPARIEGAANRAPDQGLPRRSEPPPAAASGSAPPRIRIGTLEVRTVSRPAPAAPSPALPQPSASAPPPAPLARPLLSRYGLVQS